MPEIKLSDVEVTEIIQALYVAASVNQANYGRVRHMFLARLHESFDRELQEIVKA